VIRFALQPLHPRGRIPQCSWDRKLGGPHSRSGRGGEEENFLPRLYRVSNPGCPARGLVSISTAIHLSFTSFIIGDFSGKVEMAKAWSRRGANKKMFQVEVFWVVTPCSVVVGYQRFGVPCCLHLQGENSS
jgi:hypothetical protein